MEAGELLRANRRAKLEALRERGVDPYPARFAVDGRVSEIVARFEGADAASLEAGAQRVRVGGRVTAVRGHGKAAFIDLSDGDGRLQAHLRRDVLGEETFSLLDNLDLGRLLGRRRGAVPDPDQRADGEGRAAGSAGQGAAPLAREVARPHRSRAARPAALPRPRHQPGVAPGLPGPRRRRAGDPHLPRGARLHRGRDADDAAHPRRRHGAAVRHPPQHPGPRPLPPHRARALPQAAGGGRDRAGLRDQPQLPQRGDLDPPQPRVHDARVLLGLRRLPEPHGPHRGDALPGRRRRWPAPRCCPGARSTSTWRARGGAWRCARPCWRTPTSRPEDLGERPALEAAARRFRH